MDLFLLDGTLTITGPTCYVTSTAGHRITTCSTWVTALLACIGRLWRGRAFFFSDNPVGTGFSYTPFKDGYPRTDEQLAQNILTALTQFMRILPFMVKGAKPSTMPFYAFGESYGGAYVVSLAHVYLHFRWVSSTSGLFRKALIHCFRSRVREIWSVFYCKAFVPFSIHND